MTKEKIYLLLILFLYVGLNLPFLTAFPPIDNMGDESWMMNISEGILKWGKPIASIHVGTPIGEEPQIVTSWIYNGALAGIFYIFGSSLWSGRFLSFLCGIGVIILTYYFGKNIGSPKVGLTSAFLLTTSIAFTWHSREMRPEMMLLLFITMSIYLFYIALQSDKYIFLLLSGLVATLSVQVHPHGVLFAFSIFIIYLIIYRKKIFSRPTLFLLIGFSIGFTTWVVFNYIPYSSSSFDTIHKRYLPPIGREDIFYLLLKSIQRILSLLTPEFLNLWIRIQYFSDISIGFLYFALFLTIVSLFFGNQQKKLIFLLSLIILPLWLSTFLAGVWSWFHFSVFLVIASIVFSISVFDISERLAIQRLKAIFIYGVILIYGTVGLIDITKKNIEMKKFDFNTFKSRMSEGLPEGATVMGSGIYYFAIKERKDIRFMTYLFIMGRCPDIETEIKKYKVDFILVDEILMNLSEWWCSRLYRDKLMEYINKKTTLLYTIHTKIPNSLTANRFLTHVDIRKVN